MKEANGVSRRSLHFGLPLQGHSAPRLPRIALPRPPAGLLTVLLCSGFLPAQTTDDTPVESGNEREEWVLPPQVPRPSYMSEKPFLPDFLLKDKREGWYWAGLPAIGYDDEQGLNLGAIAQVFNNGSKDDPYFRSTPYRSKAALAAVASTERNLRLFAALDFPYLLETPYRLRVGGGVLLNPINNYFGVGEDSMKSLNFPGAPGVKFDDFGDYKSALDRQVAGQTFASYNQWESREYPLAVLLEKDYMGGLIRPLVGLRIQFIEIDDATGDRVDAKGGKAIQEPTKLLEDHLAGRIDGFNGGWDNYVKLGISFDNRDFEPDPTSGVFAQISADISTRVLGSEYDYQRITSAVAIYKSLFPESTRLVFASRALYSMQFGKIPFFSMNTLSFNTLNEEGLGGFHSLRGYKRNRFIGDSAVLVNAELRWSFTEWRLGKQHLRPMLVPFVEAGRVHDQVELDFERWKISYGGGFRLSWNLSTIVSFDYGVSREGQIFFMELGHAF